MANALKLGKDQDAPRRAGRPLARRISVLGVLAGMMLVLPVLAPSQTAVPDSAKPPLSTSVPTDSGQQQQAVVRLAHFSFVEGRVMFRTDSSGQWTEATVNMPLREGAQITTDGSARAEIQFDDGSTLRMTDSAVFTLKSLYSDIEGEFTELSMTDGTATLHALNQYSIYQIDTPDGDVKADGPSKIRLDAASYLMVGVEQGKATLTNLDGEYKLQEGDFAQIEPDRKGPEIEDLPAPDDWDQFCDARDAQMAVSNAYMPSDVAIGAGDLDEHGNWQPDPDYGFVWYPSGQTDDWQPYCNGNWVWFQPVGWTWVSAEPWGWAPYHYGTWIHRTHGWAWVPGPRHQRWSPAMVWFTTSGNNVVWTALAPCEVHYTPVDVAFHHGDWSNYFSIGAAGVYRPAGPDYVVAHDWSSLTLNRGDTVRAPEKPQPAGHVFLPHNANDGGAVEGTLANFQSGKGFQRAGYDVLDVFAHGSSLVASQPLAGPANVRPTQASTSPTRRFEDNSLYTSTLDRAVFVAHGKAVVTSESAPVVASSSPGTKVLRPRADWNSASAAAAAAKARQVLNYVPRTSPPDPEMTVRHVAPSQSQSENGGYGGFQSYTSHMSDSGQAGQGRQWDGNRGWSHRESGYRQPMEPRGEIRERTGQMQPGRPTGPQRPAGPQRPGGNQGQRQAAPQQNRNDHH